MIIHPKGNEIFQSGGRTDRVTHLPRPQSACISANAQFKRKFPRYVTTISTNLIIQRIERGDFFQTAWLMTLRDLVHTILPADCVQLRPPPPASKDRPCLLCDLLQLWICCSLSERIHCIADQKSALLFFFLCVCVNAVNQTAGAPDHKTNNRRKKPQTNKVRVRQAAAVTQIPQFFCEML